MSSLELSQNGVETHYRLSKPLRSSPLLPCLYPHESGCDRKHRISHGNVNCCECSCGLHGHGRKCGRERWCGYGCEGCGVRGREPRLLYVIMLLLAVCRFSRVKHARGHGKEASVCP